jgi:hypothetical protein
MENEISKAQKSKDKNKYKAKGNTNNIESNNTNNNTNINGKILLIFKQQWDKIELEYNTLIKKIENISKIISSPSKEMQKEIKSLISSLITFKNNLKNIFFNLGINIGNTYNENSDYNEYNNNNNQNTINFSYDIIYNEFVNIESIIKDINIIENKNKRKKRKQIENLENKLHEYMDEIDNLDFNKMDKLYDKYNNNKNEVEKIILQNDFIEQYNYRDFEIKNEKKNNIEVNEVNEGMNINSLNTLGQDSDSMRNKKKIIDGILNMNENNKDNAIKYIQNLIKKEKNDK